MMDGELKFEEINQISSLGLAQKFISAIIKLPLTKQNRQFYMDFITIMSKLSILANHIKFSTFKQYSECTLDYSTQDRSYISQLFDLLKIKDECTEKEEEKSMESGEDKKGGIAFEIDFKEGGDAS